MVVFHDSKVDRVALRAWRLERIREQLRLHDYGGILLFDPVNIRYATDTSNMQVWTLHNKVRYAYIATEGPVILFDFANCAHLSSDIEVIDEVRVGKGLLYFGSGSRLAEKAQEAADEIANLVRQHGNGNSRLAVDKMDPVVTHAFDRTQIQVMEGEVITEHARLIKNDVEIQAMMESIDACQEGMHRMQKALTPGMTENALWSILHQTNIELGGEWIETRLLTSGPRTNPWFQECSNRQIQVGELVSFDTDLVGPNGYCSDISRSWLCGDVKPSEEQKTSYKIAMDMINYNTALIKPGLGFRELAEKAYKLPDEYIKNRYCVVVHGIGLCDEYPAVTYIQDFDQSGYDGVFEENMTICVEALVGKENGKECVKLEEQMLITKDGVRNLSDFPYEDILLS